MKHAASLVLALASLLLLTPAAHAQLFRTYLASYGSDSNPCTVVAPCRLVPAALTAVAPGGEIWILDSANFNSDTVEIDRPVTILAVPGAVGSIVAVAGHPAIDIATNGARVVLRNLVIGNNALNPGTYGIHITGAQTVTLLDHCVIQGTPQQGILANATDATIYVQDSEIRNVGHIAVEANDGVTLDVVRTKLSANYYGGLYAHPLTATGVTHITVTDSVISGDTPRLNQTSYGLLVFTQVAGGLARIYANRVSISNMNEALNTGGAGTSAIEIGNSMVTHNAYNLYSTTGTVASLGNNHISDALNADTGSLTPVAPR